LVSDLFLPYDLDALFSSAFAIVLIDSIIPASEEQWGIDEAFSVFDHMISRGVATAVVYQEHLVEMNDFRLMLRASELNAHSAPSEPNEDSNIVNTSTSATAEPSTFQGDPALDHHLDQDLVWSWMSTENNSLGVMHPNTIQSAITGLDLDSMTTSLDFDADNQWLWGTYLGDNAMI
jgi:hypothetical protein